MSQPDVVLVVRARDGDRVAFEELVRRTSRLVFARLYLDSGRANHVEDLLQETFLRAFRSLRRLEDPTGFRPWLLTIAHNVLVDDARRAARQIRVAPPTDMRLSLLPSPELPPDEVAERTELRQRVLVVLRSLPAEYQMPLTLRYITGADHDTICEQLGLSNGALRGLLHRGLKLLRDRLPPDLATAFAR